MGKKDIRGKESRTCWNPRAVGRGYPKVTGILVIAIGKATKIIPLLLTMRKQYICIMKIHGDFNEKKLRKIVNEFIGPIYQRPPLRSSVKRVIRIRRIYNIEILEIHNRRVLMKIDCESGTYIRKLCYDIGDVLGPGAHMEELRRTKVGHFEEKDAVTLYDVLDAYKIWKEEGEEKFLRKVLLPVEYAVQNTPKIFIKDSAVSALCHGAHLAIPGIIGVETDIKVGDMVAILTINNRLVGIGQALMTSEEMVSEDRGLAVKPSAILLEPKDYPPDWKKKKFN
ncbi:MAG TPA: RNA-guided pseudouridylation complex pseudouridine synthase subunit Cbf5 [Thermoprotei archaeon]|nr:RNA-guided pseudouridylation complex pseudouridine synthase subunit Cbf5 [Thermoprotei archaeon]